MVNIVSFSDLKKDDDDEEGIGGEDAGNFAPHAYNKRPALKKGTMEGYIYHELQESALCGQHCLNNLMQSHVFTAIGLGDIARGLDEQEARLSAGLSGESANVDASGNFSIQVLRAALQQHAQIELVSWSGEAGRQTVDPLQEDGFIVNRREHWFAIRKINGKWFNLNSTQELPEHISDFYVAASMAQLRNDGFTVFIPTRGRLPKAGALPTSVLPHHTKFWVQESLALNPPPSTGAGSGKSGAAAKPAFESFSGAGRRLDGSSIQDQSQPPSHSLGYGIPSGAEQEQDDDPELAAAIAASLGGAAPSHSHISNSNSNFNPAVSGSSEDSFDADLAKALAMSQQESESVPTGPVKSDKEIAREKRLAALEKRGL